LFGRYGLLILNPDDRKLKGQFADIMTDELLHENSQPLVAAQMDKLSVHYKAQAHPRNINLFYLSEGLRERIEKRDDKWIVVNTDKSWSKEELLSEVASFPERFSPNVILRGLFQETILPDVAFIGGGAEVAYWLQLGSLFRHYNCFFPVILLRQSIQWVTADEGRLLEQLQLQPADVFLPESALVRQFVSRQALDEWQTASETKQLETLMTAIKEKATALDPTLRSSADAALTKMRYQLQVLEKKMLRAEKRKMQDSVARIQKLRRLAMPAGSLQERTENFMSWYLRFGNDYLKILADAIDPLRNEFLIIRERENS
ncbi:MAG: bacillithiol biosynthesis BshC, partial [Sphingobacteriales bacterium]